MADEQQAANRRRTVAPVNERRREPATFYGEPMLSGQPPYASPYPQGPLEAFGRSFGSGVEDVMHRWRALSGAEESVTQEEFDEIVGDAPVEVSWSPSMTRERATFLRDEARRRQWQQQFESRPVAQFLGEALPTVADPISVLTMPVGGTSFKAVSEAATLGKVLKHSTAGGAKVGAATAPLELSVQPTFYGEVRPEMVAGAALAPVAASPLLALPGYALRSIGGARSGVEDPEAAIDMAETAAKQGDMEADVAGATSSFTDVDADLPAPPMGTRPPDNTREPRAELDRLFGDWDGKERGWLRDLAAGDEAAGRRAREIGVDPESPALQAFLREEGRRTDARTRVAEDDRFTQLQDFTDFVKGRATSEQRQRLAADGLIESAESARIARETPQGKPSELPDNWRLGEVQRQLREQDAREEELRDLSASPAMRPVQEALEIPAGQRTADQQEVVRAFQENGVGIARNVRIQQQRRRYQELLDREADLEAELAKAQQGHQQIRGELRRTQAERQRTYEEIDALENAGRTEVDGQFDIAEFVSALEAARMESAPLSSRADAEPRPQAPGRDEVADANAATKAENDPEVQRMREYAEKHGADVDAADAEVGRFLNHVREC